MVYCSNCGSQLIDGAKFCSSCGTARATQTNATDATKVLVEPQVSATAVKSSRQGQISSFFKGVGATVAAKTVCQRNGHDFQPVEGKCEERCSVCGHKQELEHDYQQVEGKCKQKCAHCGKTKDIPHQYNGTCTCAYCGKVRDEKHSFQPIEGKCIQKCTNCGKEEELPHQWKGQVCTRCGETRSLNACIKDTVATKFPDSAQDTIRKYFWLFVSGALLLLFIITLGIIGSINGAKNPSDSDRNLIVVPSSASDLVGKNYNDVLVQFQKAGFTDIETEPLGDLIAGWLYDDGEVQEISIDGGSDFASDSKFQKDRQPKVVIRYHSYPETETGTISGDTDKTTESATKATTASHDNIILTVENNEDFAALLKDGNDAMASAFVKKYYGRTIEFDGYCWDWMNHTSWSPFTGKETVYKTLFDSCIWVGDVEDVETNTAGPTFRVENVRYPNFTTVLNRKNVHVIAKVGIYDEDKQFIMLSYDSIEYR